jgi:hypothetical protein
MRETHPAILTAVRAPFDRVVAPQHFKLGASVGCGVALFIGTIELVGLFTDKLGLRGAVADWFQNFNINTTGFSVGMFIVTWALALAIWRFAKLEEKWALGMELAKARSASEGFIDWGLPRRRGRRFGLQMSDRQCILRVAFCAIR